MTSPFDISTPNTTVKVNDKGKAQVNFTVANKSTAVIKGRATVNSDTPEVAKWFAITGETERTFPVNGKQNYAVQLAVPPGTAPGSYPARLHVVDVSNPDEIFSQSATIMFEVSPPKPAGKGFPIWIPIVAGTAVLVVVIGVILALVLLGGDPKVPNIVGLQADKAEKAISDAGFKVGKVELIAIDNEENLVIEQSLEADKPAKKDSAIDLKVVAPKVNVPDFLGQDFENVQKQLIDLKLTLGASGQKVTGKPEKSILEQNPPAGTRILRGAPVSFVIESPRVRVPDTLVGKDVGTAQATLSQAGLVLGSTSTKVTGKTGGTILETSPKPGELVLNGTAINLVIEETKVKVPSYKTLTQAAAEAKIKADGFTVGKITTAVSRDGRKGLVLSQKPDATSSYNKNSPIDLVISVEPSNLHSKGISLVNGFTLDFDSGRTDLPLSDARVDILVQNGFVSPRNNAAITLMNGNGSPEYMDCKTASYPTSAVAVSNLTSSNAFCIRTNDGRFGVITEFNKFVISSGVSIIGKNDPIAAKPLFSTSFHTWKEPKDELLVAKPITATDTVLANCKILGLC
jgi:beta-lactam-binding protein with PASTA domain